MLRVIPDIVKDQTIRFLRASSTAEEAARLMREHDISAVVVLADDDRLEGIVTERDITRRVAADDRLASRTSLGEIMTKEVHTVAPDQAALEALELMRSHRVRHLPVVREQIVVGMVSMRDLRRTVSQRALERGSNPIARALHSLGRRFE